MSALSKGISFQCADCRLSSKISRRRSDTIGMTELAPKKIPLENLPLQGGVLENFSLVKKRDSKKIFLR